MVRLVATCTSGYKQAPHKPILQGFSLLGGESAFSRNLYFHVQTGTTPNLFLLVYEYRVVYLVAYCTSIYKQAPQQSDVSCLCLQGGAFLSQIVLPCTNRHQNKPIFSCLCLWGGALSRNLYFRVQAGTKTNLFLVACFHGVVLLVAYCTSVYKQAPQQIYLTGDLVVYFWGVVLLVATCTSEYK